jgi:hypothetical protein
MWYSGHDGSAVRVLHAIQPVDGPWQRLGIAVDLGLAGVSDSYGVESPSVVATPDGYLMAYAGSDGTETRLHLARSADGTAWKPLGPLLPADEHDAVSANHPWLLTNGPDWWLFYSGYDGSRTGRASILAAVSSSGTEWDRQRRRRRHAVRAEPLRHPAARPHAAAVVHRTADERHLRRRPDLVGHLHRRRRLGDRGLSPAAVSGVGARGR